MMEIAHLAEVIALINFEDGRTSSSAVMSDDLTFARKILDRINFPSDQDVEEAYQAGYDEGYNDGYLEGREESDA